MPDPPSGAQALPGLGGEGQAALPAVPGPRGCGADGQRLAGLGAVVTGAAGGIGRGVVRALAAEGARVLATDLEPGLLHAQAELAAAADAGARVETVAGDVTSETDMVRVAAAAEAAFGRLDILVTCAGLGHAGLLAEQPSADWLRVVDVNLGGTYRAIRAALPAMRRQGRGRIVTIASIFGRVGGSGFITAYAASKHGVLGLTRALAAELGGEGHHGITVNAVCPGYVRAGMGLRMQTTRAGLLEGAEVFERYYRRRVPIRRMIEAEEIGGAVVFLALPSSGGITGQALNVDGGFVMS